MEQLGTSLQDRRENVIEVLDAGDLVAPGFQAEFPEHLIVRASRFKLLPLDGLTGAGGLND